MKRKRENISYEVPEIMKKAMKCLPDDLLERFRNHQFSIELIDVPSPSGDLARDTALVYWAALVLEQAEQMGIFPIDPDGSDDGLSKAFDGFPVLDADYWRDKARNALSSGKH